MNGAERKWLPLRHFNDEVTMSVFKFKTNAVLWVLQMITIKIVIQTGVTFSLWTQKKTLDRMMGHCSLSFYGK